MAGKRQEWRLGKVYAGTRLIMEQKEDGEIVTYLTPEEMAQWRRETIQTMGRTLNNSFTHNPDMFVRACQEINARTQPASA